MNGDDMQIGTCSCTGVHVHVLHATITNRQKTPQRMLCACYMYNYSLLLKHAHTHTLTPPRCAPALGTGTPQCPGTTTHHHDTQDSVLGPRYQITSIYVVIQSREQTPPSPLSPGYCQQHSQLHTANMYMYVCMSSR